MKLEPDIYTRCVSIAKAYYRMLRRRDEIDEEIIMAGVNPPDGLPKGQDPGNPTAQKAEKLIARKQENEKKINAVEKAWAECRSDNERDFVKKNLLEGMQMWQIYIPMSNGKAMSERTMKRYRKQFLFRLAKNLYEI